MNWCSRLLKTTDHGLSHNLGLKRRLRLERFGSDWQQPRLCVGTEAQVGVAITLAVLAEKRPSQQQNVFATYRAAMILSLLSITDAEQRQLKTLISSDLATERNTVRERSGMTKRTDFNKIGQNQMHQRVNRDQL